tara:strand:+ start:439 stop:699 length:261 start_codon:yes stop_codon:yes gene_type:complete
MNFLQENITAIATTAIIGLFSFIFTVSSDVAVLKSRSAGSEKASDLILKEIRFVKVNQGKIHKEITDTRERVIKLEVKLNERQIAK